MLKSYQSVYVISHRWMFKNFGQGKLPLSKSLFNISFLLVVLLTATLLCMQLALKMGLIRVNVYSVVTIMLGTLFFVFLNHLIFLNNKWVSRLNGRMKLLGRHNLNTWTVVLLINVILICGFVLIIAG